MARSDMFYLDKSFSRVSLKKIDETYEYFNASIQRKWPGYVLNTRGYIENKSDIVVNVDEHFALMRSNDIARYETTKD